MATMNTECAVCGGTGWKTLPAESAPAGEKKKSPQVTRCDCRVSAKFEKLLANARIPKRYDDRELSNFRIEVNGKHLSTLAKARLRAEHYVEEYPAIEPPGLILTGNSGTGKTHLAIGIIKELTKKGIDCVFADFRDLLKQVRQTYNSQTSNTEMSTLKPFLTAEVLVLDDIGAEKDSEWVEETVGYILNDRYNNKKAVILTTNLANLAPTMSRSTEPVDNFSKARRAMKQESLGDRVGQRIWSRLAEMCTVVEIESDIDYRRKDKAQAGQ
ncbi:MAG: replication protein DNAC-like protein [Acidobacteriales bacterium]|nr:replication protein DNAC-like protein [Terriglobales bacterium]